MAGGMVKASASPDAAASESPCSSRLVSVASCAIISLLIRNNRRHLDLDKPLGARERCDDQPGRTGEHALEERAHLAVDALAIADVGEIDDGAADMLELGAGFLQQR